MGSGIYLNPGLIAVKCDLCNATGRVDEDTFYGRYVLPANNTTVTEVKPVEVRYGTKPNDINSTNPPSSIRTRRGVKPKCVSGKTPTA